MTRQKKPWAVFLPGPVARYCVDRSLEDMMEGSFVQQVGRKLLAYLRGGPAPNEPTDAEARFLRRSLRQPRSVRREWVARHGKGRMLETVCAGLLNARARTRDRDICVIDTAWVPDLVDVLGDNNWTRVEPPETEQDFDGVLPLTHETLRGWLKIGGHPDLGRYLLDYMANPPACDDLEV